MQFSRKGHQGTPKPENMRGGGEEEEEETNRPNSSLSTLPAVFSGQSENEEFPPEITEEEVITGECQLPTAQTTSRFVYV